MPRKGQRKCAGCGEWVQTDWEAADYDGDYRYSRAGKLFCHGCFETGEYSASTVVEFVPRTNDDDVDNESLYNDVIVTKFDEDFTYLVTSNGEVADWEDDQDYPEPIAGQRWVRTDAWRGYSAFDWLEGFEALESGWVTGFPDETTRRKAELGELFEDIRDGSLPCPVRLFWVFGVTSNVFSTACDIVVASADREQLAAWFLEVCGTSAEDLHYQLG